MAFLISLAATHTKPFRRFDAVFAPDRIIAGAGAAHERSRLPFGVEMPSPSAPRRSISSAAA